MEAFVYCVIVENHNSNNNNSPAHGENLWIGRGAKIARRAVAKDN